MKETRYSRQELFSPIGNIGQEKFKNKHVLIIGAGALGSSSAEMLVRSGIGTITIVDRDYVEYSNLQRQQLYTEEDVERRLPKAVAAQRRLQQVNTDVNIKGIISDVSIDELETLIVGVDVIVDATDNFETRLMINDISQKYSVPWVFGSCVGSYGMSYTFIPNVTPCFHCLLENIPTKGMTCDTVGVIAPVVTMVSSYQVTEVMKLLIGDMKSIRKTLVTFDLWNNQRMDINMDGAKKTTCLSCGVDATYPYLQKENISQSVVLCGRNTVQIRPAKHRQELDLHYIEEQLRESGKKVDRNIYLLITEIDNHRVVLFQDGRMLVHDTKDTSFARKVYQQLLG